MTVPRRTTAKRSQRSMGRTTNTRYHSDWGKSRARKKRRSSTRTSKRNEQQSSSSRMLIQHQPEGTSELLRCGICYDVTETPFKMQNCTDTCNFCTQCIERCFRHSTKCPVCQVESFSLCPNQTKTNLIETASDVFPCPKKVRPSTVAPSSSSSSSSGEQSKKCLWVGNIREYLEHKKKCINQEVSCPCCSEQMCRGDLGEIYEFNLNFPTEPNDSKKIPDRAYNDVQYLDAQGCVVTNTFSGHYAVCPSLVVKCMYYAFGCMDVFCQRNRAAHYERFVKEHQGIQCRMIDSAKRETESLKEKVSSLEKEAKVREEQLSTFL